jgi:hypothetical protein
MIASLAEGKLSTSAIKNNSNPSSAIADTTLW